MHLFGGQPVGADAAIGALRLDPALHDLGSVLGEKVRRAV
jgi:hypothetical protein